jgi:predicted Fe-S protein YdhL (DUF1289 family)
MTTSVSHIAPALASADNCAHPQRFKSMCQHRYGVCSLFVHLHCAGCDRIIYETPNGLQYDDGVHVDPVDTVEQCHLCDAVFCKDCSHKPREIFTLVIGDLKFERSADSMAVYRYDARIDRVDLPVATEFAFFRAAHAYCEAQRQDIVAEAA